MSWFKFLKKTKETVAEVMPEVLPPSPLILELMERKQIQLEEKRRRQELAKNYLREQALQSLRDYPASAVYIAHLSCSPRPEDWVVQELNEECRQMGFKVDSCGRIEVP